MIIETDVRPLDAISTKLIFSFEMDSVFLRKRINYKHNCRQMTLDKHALYKLHDKKKALPRS